MSRSINFFESLVEFLRLSFDFSTFNCILNIFKGIYYFFTKPNCQHFVLPFEGLGCESWSAQYFLNKFLQNFFKINLPSYGRPKPTTSECITDIN